MTSVASYGVELVAFHVTAVCQHRCPFCYAASEPQQRQRHPPLARLIQVADALAEASVREITLLGGDPASHPQLVPLARHCSELGMIVSVLSNTHAYSSSTIEEAARYVSSFETTIHAATPAGHDAICGKNGAFIAVVEQMRAAASMGRKTGIALNVTPATANALFDIANNLRAVHQLSVDYIIVQRIIPFGRAQSTSDFAINRKHAEEALIQIQRIDRELGIRITVEDPFPLCILSPKLRRYMSPCQWGISKAAVNADGDLSRCGADPRYRLGNILSTPLLDLWNSSPTLKSFRERAYLPGRCQTCSDLTTCGGGCPLSCEIEKDHGLDYLFLEYQRLDVEIHGNLTFAGAQESELSSILQIEWSDFPDCGHVFSVASIRSWYMHNPGMFFVLKDEKNWVMAYACLVPVSRSLHNRIAAGQVCALTQFPPDDVSRDGTSDYYHVEAVASVPSRSSSRVGRCLIKEVGRELLGRAKFLTASPVTEIGGRLCKYFGFSHSAFAKTSSTNELEKQYEVQYLAIDDEAFRQRVERF